MMNNELRPYEKYKESKNPFSSMIPEGWQESRFHNIVKLKSICGNSNEELLSVYLNQGVIKYSDTSQKQVHKPSEDMSNYQLVEPGDLVMNNQQAWRGSLGVSKHRGVVSPAYYVFGLSNNINSTFANYLFRESAMVSQYVTSSKGVGTIQRNLFYPYLKNAIVALPPRLEQDQIVKYLDHQLAKINKFIKVKKKLIAVLKEQKQAIINKAVTRGLDSKVKMRPSGIEWLGDVPEHWQKKRVKNLFKCLNYKRIPLSSSERGLMKSRQYDYYGASGIIDKVDNYIFDDDLLLIAEDGANLVMRNLQLAIIARGKFWVNNHAHILKPNRNSLEYMAYLLESIDYRPYISGAAQPKLTKDRLLAIEVVVPNIEEQDAIVAFIRKETKKLEETIVIATREVELMIEYKNSLITDVVTGKVDVRNIVIEELEEEIIEDLELDEDSIDDEVLEAEDGDE